jgi:hypothetical protein
VALPAPYINVSIGTNSPAAIATMCLERGLRRAGTLSRCVRQLTSELPMFSVDGVDVTQELLHVEKEKIEKFDLSKSFNLRRRFDVALCLEVGEHLPGRFK